MLEHRNQIQVRLDNGEALVTSASGQFHVSQKDRPNAISSCPMHLMLGALGACIMLTLHAVSRHKGIAIGDSDIRLDCVQEKDGRTRFRVALKLDDRLTDREQKILYQSARVCEVGKVLKSDVQIDYHLMENAVERTQESEPLANG